MSRSMSMILTKTITIENMKDSVTIEIKKQSKNGSEYIERTFRVGDYVMVLNLENEHNSRYGHITSLDKEHETCCIKVDNPSLELPEYQNITTTLYDLVDCPYQKKKKDNTEHPVKEVFVVMCSWYPCVWEPNNSEFYLSETKAEREAEKIRAKYTGYKVRVDKLKLKQ